MERAVRKALHEYGAPRVELEFRLGHRGPGGRFRAGVSREKFEEIRAVLDASPAWTLEELDSTESVTADGSKLVEYADGARQQHWVHKKRLLDDTDTRPAAPDAPWVVRTSLSLEEAEAYAPGLLEQLAPPRFSVRRRKRRASYRHRCWSLDLTVVRSTLVDAEDESYEVELELVDTDEFLVRPVSNVLQWGKQIITDVCNF